jgi:hypothetical protein
VKKSFFPQPASPTSLSGRWHFVVAGVLGRRGTSARRAPVGRDVAPRRGPRLQRPAGRTMHRYRRRLASLAARVRRARCLYLSRATSVKSECPVPARGTQRASAARRTVPTCSPAPRSALLRGCPRASGADPRRAHAPPRGLSSMFRMVLLLRSIAGGSLGSRGSSRMGRQWIRLRLLRPSGGVAKGGLESRWPGWFPLDTGRRETEVLCPLWIVGGAARVGDARCG